MSHEELKEGEKEFVTESVADAVVAVANAGREGVGGGGGEKKPLPAGFVRWVDRPVEKKVGVEGTEEDYTADVAQRNWWWDPCQHNLIPVDLAKGDRVIGAVEAAKVFGEMFGHVDRFREKPVTSELVQKWMTTGDRHRLLRLESVKIRKVRYTTRRAIIRFTLLVDWIGDELVLPPADEMMTFEEMRMVAEADWFSELPESYIRSERFKIATRRAFLSADWTAREVRQRVRKRRDDYQRARMALVDKAAMELVAEGAIDLTPTTRPEAASPILHKAPNHTPDNPPWPRNRPPVRAGQKLVYHPVERRFLPADQVPREYYGAAPSERLDRNDIATEQAKLDAMIRTRAEEVAMLLSRNRKTAFIPGADWTPIVGSDAKFHYVKRKRASRANALAARRANIRRNIRLGAKGDMKPHPKGHVPDPKDPLDEDRAFMQDVQRQVQKEKNPPKP